MADVVDLTSDDGGQGGMDERPMADWQVGRRGRRRERSAGKEAKAAEVVVIPSDDEESAAAQQGGDGGMSAAPSSAKRARKKDKRAADAPPSWQGLDGARRLMAEFKEMQVEIQESGPLGAPCGPAHLHNLTFHADNMFCWRMELQGFDSDLAEGKNLNADLLALERLQTGKGTILIEGKPCMCVSCRSTLSL